MEDLVNINLFGQDFSFKADADSKNAKAVADFLVSEVEKVEKQISQTSSEVPKLTIMILTALNITNEYFELKQNFSDMQQVVLDRSSHLIKTLEKVVD